MDPSIIDGQAGAETGQKPILRRKKGASVITTAKKEATGFSGRLCTRETGGRWCLIPPENRKKAFRGGGILQAGCRKAG